MPLNQVKLIDFPKFKDNRGNLSFIEEERHIPFKIERVYWIYDVPGGEMRGGHAFREQKEIIIALSGSELQENKEECLEVGMDDFIEKPIRAEKLNKFVSQLVQ